MKDVEHWKREGFVFEARFPNEYDLWMNRGTMQKLRRYVDGRECLSDSTTGKYRLVQDAPTNGPAPFEVESVAFEGPKTPDQGDMTPYTCLTCPQCGSVFQWPSPFNSVHCGNCGYEARSIPPMVYSFKVD
jgi:hypothetical protein